MSSEDKKTVNVGGKGGSNQTGAQAQKGQDFKFQ